jgi:hypothetical protein
MDCLTRRYLAHFERPRFDEACQACYVIVCCGERPARLGAMTAELEVLRPLRAVDVCLFAGHRSCPLSEHSAHDLNNNFLYVFRDALRRGAERALVLEDDFHVERFEDDDASSIADFLRANNPCVYGLGNFMVPTLGTVLSRHQKLSGGSGTFSSSHATFFGREYMRKVVDFFEGAFGGRPPADFQCVDKWPEFFGATVFRYHRPLVTQVFARTENQTEGWTRCKPGSLNPLQTSGVVMLLRGLNLHNKTQPGWNILYFVGTFGRLVAFAALALMLLLLFCR